MSTNSVEFHKHILVAVHDIIKVGVAQDNDFAGQLLSDLGFRAGLLLNEGLERLEVSLGIVVYRLIGFAVEILQCGEALNSESLSEVFVVWGSLVR